MTACEPVDMLLIGESTDEKVEEPSPALILREEAAAAEEGEAPDPFPPELLLLFL